MLTEDRNLKVHVSNLKKSKKALRYLKKIEKEPFKESTIYLF